LEGKVQAGTGALVGLHLKDAFAVNQDVTGGDLVLGVTCDDLGEGGLAGAVGAHQSMNFACRNGQVDSLENLFAISDPGVQATDLKIVVCHVVSYLLGDVWCPRGQTGLFRTHSEFEYTRVASPGSLRRSQAQLRRLNRPKKNRLRG